MKFLTLFVAFHLFCYLPLFSAVDKEGDFQVWTSLTSSFKLVKEKVDFFIREEFRFGDDASKLYYMYIEPRLEFLAAKCFSWGPGYRQIYLAGEKHKWNFQYAPFIDFYLKKEVKGWKFINRFRFMYFFRERARDSWHIRSRFTVILPWQIKRMNMTPIAYNEFFFDQRQEFFQNRLFFGGRFKASERVTFDLGYILRYIKLDNHRWIHHNILNISFDLSY